MTIHTFDALASPSPSPYSPLRMAVSLSRPPAPATTAVLPEMTGAFDDHSFDPGVGHRGRGRAGGGGSRRRIRGERGRSSTAANVFGVLLVGGN